eukprot:sb/3466452/
MPVNSRYWEKNEDNTDKEEPAQNHEQDSQSETENKGQEAIDTEKDGDEKAGFKGNEENEEVKEVKENEELKENEEVKKVKENEEVKEVKEVKKDADRKKRASEEGDKTLELNSGNVCSYYLNKNCRHGRKGDQLVNGKACQKLHPVLCKKFCHYGGSKRFGCTKGTQCKFYHPPLCKGSDARRACYDNQCRMTHLLHTRRTREEPQNPWKPEGAKRTTAGKPSAVVDSADTEFRAKRPRKMPEADKVGEPVTKEFLLETLEKIKAEPPRKEKMEGKTEGPLTKDFLLRALEEMKAEINQSVVRQLIEFKTQLVDPAGGSIKAPTWGTAGIRPILQSFTS